MNKAIDLILGMKAILNDGQVMYGVNDLYIGQRTHISSRYQIQIGGNSEFQSSSGVIISTGLGATGGGEIPMHRQAVLCVLRTHRRIAGLNPDW